VAGEFGMLHSEEIYNLFSLRNNIKNANQSNDENGGWVEGGERCACKMNGRKQKLTVHIISIAKTEKKEPVEKNKTQMEEH